MLKSSYAKNNQISNHLKNLSVSILVVIFFSERSLLLLYSTVTKWGFKGLRILENVSRQKHRKGSAVLPFLKDVVWLSFVVVLQSQETY
jgi:hypothetical protein